MCLSWMVQRILSAQACSLVLSSRSVGSCYMQPILHEARVYSLCELYLELCEKFVCIMTESVKRVRNLAKIEILTLITHIFRTTSK